MSPHGISSSPIDQVKTSISYAEKESAQRLTPAQASQYWFLQGLRFMKDNPLKALSLYITKVSLFWRKEELPLNVDYALSKTLVPLFRLPLISFGIIAPLALLGIILSFTRKTGMPLVILFIASHLLSVTIFFVTARYRVLAVPFLIICSSYALYGAGEMIRARDTKNIFIFGALLALLFTGINKDFSSFAFTDPAKHYSNLGMVLHRQGKADEALSTLQKALAIDPYCLEAHYNLGNLYHNKGQLTEAIEAYKKALQINSGFAEAHNNLGIAYGEQGLLNEAILEFNRALEADSNFADAYYNRGTAYGKKGALDEAISDLKKALTLDPEHAGAQFNLGMAYTSKGMRNEAIVQFKKAIALDPNLKAAYGKLGLEE
jgi:tetratricopeptide (TPR) repeat protein